MNKKVLVFFLVIVGLGGFVWWKSQTTTESASEKLARAVKIMEGLQSRAIPVEFSSSQLSLLEEVYRDSLDRLPSIRGFRDADKTKLINELTILGFNGSGTNGLNVLGENILSLSLGRPDEFKNGINSHILDLGNVSQTKKDEINKLAQSINTLTNDIRLTSLYVSWYEGIRGKLCSTTDANNDIYVVGEVQFMYNNQSPLPDTCTTTNTLKQHKCIAGIYENGAAYTLNTTCPNGCSNGACLEQNTKSFELTIPDNVTVGTDFNIRVKATINGIEDQGYTESFFIIIDGDDDATFPTGALRMNAGEGSKTVSGISFTQTGTMTLTVRDQAGREKSATITVTHRTSETATATTETTGTTGTNTTTTTETIGSNNTTSFTATTATNTADTNGTTSESTTGATASIGGNSTTTGETGGTTTTDTTTPTPTLITGQYSQNVSNGLTDCWFGYSTKNITLSELKSYLKTPLQYLDEVITYGGSEPAPNDRPTDIISFENPGWISANTGVSVNESIQLTNFFIFRASAHNQTPPVRSWDIPTNGIKFYGCYQRGDRPTIW